jgi:AraC-like DNA-binding protein/mannose-6-phosphate isomerase-like protein (cupin superfamily)
VTPVALYQPFPMLPGRRAQAWRHQPSFLRPRHFHREPELNLVVRGTAQLALGERVLRASQGDCLFFAPGQDHQLVGASTDLELFAIALTPELLAHVQPTACAVRRLNEGELTEATTRLQACGQLRDACAVEQALVPLFETHTSPRVRRSTRLGLERLLLEPAVSGSALASHARTSQSELSRHFRREVGVRFVEYRARLRLMAFIAKVDAGQSLTQAALDADFGSYAQCHRVFRRTLGCGPLQYFAERRRAIDDLTNERDDQAALE